MSDSFSLTSTALPSATRVLAFRGTEALSALYTFEIQLLIEDSAFDMGAALGAAATLSVVADAEPPYLFHGILASVESVAELANGAIYVVTLAPRLSRLTLTQHSRAFVDESLPAILQTVLRLEGFTVQDYTFRLAGEYPRQSHVCQYQESSLSFIARRMEREGLYWYFEQGEAQEKLVVTDSRGYHQPLSDAPVKYALVSGRGAGGVAGLQSFNCKHRSLPGRVELRGYDYLRPALEIIGDATIAGGTGTLRVQENFTTADEGKRLARIRAEELEARKIVFRGAGSVFFLRPGYTFEVEEHPRFDGDYLAIELSHSGNQLAGVPDAKDALGLDGAKEGYHVELVAIPASAQFRPERQTSVPRIYGTERATIDGEAESGYAQLDEHGRYLVRIHFDESLAKTGKASPRIRMMQPHGGGTESFHFPLRKGTEVMLTFEGGDPDRPVIAGVVPNLVTPSPVTSKNATKNILQTGGGNRLVIEDERGKEYIHIRSAHKGTYLHLGAPFNPSYTKTTSTLGTSLSFTQDISTSVTGADAQTVVEDSRVTIIGRSQVASDDPQGQEIQKLLGPGFINREEVDDLFGQITADSLQAAQDIKALASALKALMAVPPPGPSDPPLPPGVSMSMTTSNLSAVASAMKTVVADAEAFVTDADRYSQTAKIVPPPQGFDLTQAGIWSGQCSDAFDAINTIFQGDPINKNVPAILTSPPTAAEISKLTTLNTNTGPVITQMAAAYGVDTTTWKPLAMPSFPPPVAPVTAMPTLPGTSATPTYINITHPPGQETTLVAPAKTIDKWIASQAVANPELFSDVDDPDSTAMDDGSKPDLNSGSDVKIVGGDNVTLVAHDARSQIQGHSYSLVRGGQTSVLYSPFANANPSDLKRPLGFVPVVPDPTTVAQAATTYGDTYSWVDGSTTTHIIHDTTSTIDGKQTSTVNGGVSSTVHGGSDATILGGQTAKVDYSARLVGASFEAAGLKMSGVGISTNLTILKVDITGFVIKNNATDITDNVLNVINDVNHFCQRVNTIITEVSHISQAAVAILNHALHIVP